MRFTERLLLKTLFEDPLFELQHNNQARIFFDDNFSELMLLSSIK